MSDCIRREVAVNALDTALRCGAVIDYCGIETAVCKSCNDSVSVIRLDNKQIKYYWADDCKKTGKSLLGII